MSPTNCARECSEREDSQHSIFPCPGSCPPDEMHPSGEEKHILKPFPGSYSPGCEGKSICLSAHLLLEMHKGDSSEHFPCYSPNSSVTLQSLTVLFSSQIMCLLPICVCKFSDKFDGGIQTFKIKVTVIHTIKHAYLISNLNADKIKLKHT